MTRIAAASRSTNVADAAPRDSASMPAAPLPANRSRNAAPRQVRLEDREQRLLDAVAERPRPGARAGEADPARRARDDPAGVSHRSSRVGGRVARATTRRSQPASSSRRERVDRRRSSAPRVVEQRLGVGARADRELAVRRVLAATRRAAAAGRSGRGRARRPRGAARSRARRARSRRASRRPPSAGPAPPRRRVSETRTQNDSTVAAADPAAQLVELGEPEPVGALDDHHRRLGHVDADLDDGRADQHVELAVAEPRHLGVAVARPSAARGRGPPAAARAARASRFASRLGRDRALGLARRTRR